MLKKLKNTLISVFGALIIMIALYNGIWFFMRDPQAFPKIYYRVTITLLLASGLFRFKYPSDANNNFFESVQAGILFSQGIALYELLQTDSVSNSSAIIYLLLSAGLALVAVGENLRKSVLFGIAVAFGMALLKLF